MASAGPSVVKSENRFEAPGCGAGVSPPAVFGRGRANSDGGVTRRKSRVDMKKFPTPTRSKVPLMKPAVVEQALLLEAKEMELSATRNESITVIEGPKISEAQDVLDASTKINEPAAKGPPPVPVSKIQTVEVTKDDNIGQFLSERKAQTELLKKELEFIINKSAERAQKNEVAGPLSNEMAPRVELPKVESEPGTKTEEGENYLRTLIKIQQDGTVLVRTHLECGVSGEKVPGFELENVVRLIGPSWTRHLVTVDDEREIERKGHDAATQRDICPFVKVEMSDAQIETDEVVADKVVPAIVSQGSEELNLPDEENVCEYDDVSETEERDFDITPVMEVTEMQVVETVEDRNVVSTDADRGSAENEPIRFNLETTVKESEDVKAVVEETDADNSAKKNDADEEITEELVQTKPIEDDSAPLEEVDHAADETHIEKDVEVSEIVEEVHHDIRMKESDETNPTVEEVSQDDLDLQTTEGEVAKPTAEDTHHDAADDIKKNEDEDRKTGNEEVPAAEEESQPSTDANKDKTCSVDVADGGAEQVETEEKANDRENVKEDPPQVVDDLSGTEQRADAASDGVEAENLVEQSEPAVVKEVLDLDKDWYKFYWA